MAITDADIDDLYREPLATFTAARNALAKTAGSRAAEIKALEKPSAPAWAVNQLFWRERPVYDKLITASARMRQAHATQLSGAKTDVTSAEAAHRDAVKAALTSVRSILDDAGETASSATLDAVSETLRVLPTADRPGRLARPLKPLGLEALAGMLLRSGSPSSPSPADSSAPADAHGGTSAASQRKLAPDDAREARKEAERLKKEAGERARELATLTRDLRAARTEDEKARTELSRAERAFAQAETDRDDARERVTTATRELARLEAAVAAATRLAGPSSD